MKLSRNNKRSICDININTARKRAELANRFSFCQLNARSMLYKEVSNNYDNKQYSYRIYISSKTGFFVLVFALRLVEQFSAMSYPSFDCCSSTRVAALSGLVDLLNDQLNYHWCQQENKKKHKRLKQRKQESIIQRTYQSCAGSRLIAEPIVANQAQASTTYLHMAVLIGDGNEKRDKELLKIMHNISYQHMKISSTYVLSF